MAHLGDIKALNRKGLVEIVEAAGRTVSDRKPILAKGVEVLKSRGVPIVSAKLLGGVGFQGLNNQTADSQIHQERFKLKIEPVRLVNNTVFRDTRLRLARAIVDTSSPKDRATRRILMDALSAHEKKHMKPPALETHLTKKGIPSKLARYISKGTHRSQPTSRLKRLKLDAKKFRKMR